MFNVGNHSIQQRETKPNLEGNNTKGTQKLDTEDLNKATARTVECTTWNDFIEGAMSEDE